MPELLIPLLVQLLPYLDALSCCGGGSPTGESPVCWGDWTVIVTTLHGCSISTAARRNRYTAQR